MSALREAELVRFVAFVHERHRIYLRRLAGAPAPWTQDPILRVYRFTNVYRELDTVTQWIAKNWREPHADDPQLWFAMAVARLINWPETLSAMGYPAGWSAARVLKFTKLAAARRDDGKKVFTSAYIINQAVTGGYGMTKAEYLAKVVFPDLWNRRRHIQPVEGDTLESFHARLMKGYGMGTFLAAQVVADLKCAPAGVLREAEDWGTWAAPGPGSRRGMNILLGNDPEQAIRDSVWRAHLAELQRLFNTARDAATLTIPLCAQNLQNCLCEYSKYSRGYSRQRYEGA